MFVPFERAMTLNISKQSKIFYLNYPKCLRTRNKSRLNKKVQLVAQNQKNSADLPSLNINFTIGTFPAVCRASTVLATVRPNSNESYINRASHMLAKSKMKGHKPRIADIQGIFHTYECLFMSMSLTYNIRCLYVTHVSREKPT